MTASEDVLDRHDDIPDLEDVEESLDDPRLYRYYSWLEGSKRFGEKAARIAGGSGVLFAVYVVLLKLPAVALGGDLWFLSELGDPVVALLLASFGSAWLGVGGSLLWGAVAFFGLRRLQNAPTRRAVFTALRGGFVALTGAMCLGVAVTYALRFVLG